MSLSLTIPENAWRPVYNPAKDETDPRVTRRAQLNAQVTINGVSFHVDAYQVHRVAAGGMQRTVADDLDEELAAIHSAVNADGHFDTVTIAGHKYVLVLTPHY